ncbi:hypothetical protein A6A06_37220 [Streptomyces sp. CB02923]|uniref:hypothetical protein n=1 Tax=Streptomyces sp. CB02923 TaxID=1718985 RepID=UPI00093AA808|nr:hypothetical protein [Streptomyces sp. CB02923]OKI06291.1 hypothetical protein A6A06_37220 [Streptomyces sp. CB02923]
MGKAYRELEHQGLAALGDAPLSEHEPLRRELLRWLGRARTAGLDEESIEALFRTTFRTHIEEET